MVCPTVPAVNCAKELTRIEEVSFDSAVYSAEAFDHGSGGIFPPELLES